MGLLSTCATRFSGITCLAMLAQQGWLCDRLFSHAYRLMQISTDCRPQWAPCLYMYSRLLQTEGIQAKTYFVPFIALSSCPMGCKAPCSTSIHASNWNLCYCMQMALQPIQAPAIVAACRAQALLCSLCLSALSTARFTSCSLNQLELSAVMLIVQQHSIPLRFLSHTASFINTHQQQMKV